MYNVTNMLEAVDNQNNPEKLFLGEHPVSVDSFVSSAPGKGQDGIFIGKGFVAVADGQTPLAPGHEKEVIKYVKELLGALDKAKGKSTQDMFRSAIGSAKKDGVEAWAVPSSTVVDVRVVGEEIVIELLGDCFAVVKQGEQYTVIKDTGLHSQEDNEAIQKLGILMSEGKSFKEASEEIGPMLRKSRAKINTPDGYWVAANNEEASEHVEVHKFSVDSVDDILIGSDGISRLVEIFGLLTYSELLELCSEKGVKPVIEGLRELEETDPNCEKYPRFSKNDDATAAMIHFNK